MKTILDGMKRIETKEDLVKWATAINGNAMTTANKCDFQDVYARSDRSTLDRLFIEANGSRNLIVCSVHNTMAYDEIEHLLKVWAADKANKIINEEIERLTTDHMKREKELRRKEDAFEDGKRTIYRRLRHFTKAESAYHFRLTRLERLLADMTEEARRTRQENWNLKAKAAKYDAIKTALA